jgi:hypothetical protein
VPSCSVQVPRYYVIVTCVTVATLTVNHRDFNHQKSGAEDSDFSNSEPMQGCNDRGLFESLTEWDKYVETIVSEGDETCKSDPLDDNYDEFRRITVEYELLNSLENIVHHQSSASSNSASNYSKIHKSPRLNSSSGPYIHSSKTTFLPIEQILNRGIVSAIGIILGDQTPRKRSKKPGCCHRSEGINAGSASLFSKSRLWDFGSPARREYPEANNSLVCSAVSAASQDRDSETNPISYESHHSPLASPACCSAPETETECPSTLQPSRQFIETEAQVGFPDGACRRRARPIAAALPHRLHRLRPADAELAGAGPAVPGIAEPAGRGPFRAAAESRRPPAGRLKTPAGDSEGLWRLAEAILDGW